MGVIHTVELSVNMPDIAGRVAEIIDGNAHLISDNTKLRIEFVEPDGVRTGKLTHESSLARHLSAPGATTTVGVKEGRFYFDFAGRDFRKDGQRIHLRAQEQLLLYRVIVLGQEPKTVKNWAQVRFALHKRFGSRFVEEILEGKV